MAGKVMRGCIGLKQNHFRFLAIFSWDGCDDIVAIDKLKTLLNAGDGGKAIPGDLDGIDWDTFQAYYITGARKMIAIGQVNATGEEKDGEWMNPIAHLQKFTTSITLGTSIRAEVYPVMEGFELELAGII